MKVWVVAVSVEAFGIGVAAAGILVEVVYRADVGSLLITIGSCLIALGGFLWSKVYKRLE
ncbi:MAG: hypothetical protein QXH20_02510 [Candidatus Bathyarchaeia archaeon]